MENQVESIIDQMDNLMRENASLIRDVKTEVPAILEVLTRNYGKVKDLVINEDFESPEEEIRFFKYLKPRLCSHIIYLKKILFIDYNKPVSNIDKKIEYMKKALDDIQSYSDAHTESIQYLRSGKTCFDNIAFIRRPLDEPEMQGLEYFDFERDVRFRTLSDLIFSTVLANERLENYLNREIERLALEKQGKAGFNIFSPFSWTAKKTDLVELIYALCESKCINQGLVEIKTLVTIFEKVFNIELNDFYSTFKDIKRRKGERTSFLSRLIKALTRKIDETE